ncbi:MAG: ABC transporter ATP-binding protein [Alphaproteobacteria bacterium]|nr:ABC transporter ATP-binding protein [Alphaproteobacteria bacterium]
MTEPLVYCEAVSKVYRTGGLPWRRQTVQAVAEVSLTVLPGETLGVVGESGSGKSTLLRLMLRLVRPSGGRVLFEGDDLATLPAAAMRARRRRMQAVFQDPTSSFNPRQSIGTALSAPLEVHGIGDRRARRRKVVEALDRVGLNASFAERFPHQLSGGQRQRAAIARAIILEPALVLADEPTSALDVSVQAQILNLFKETKRDLGLTYVFVSHNLGVIRYVSDRVAVMYRGRVVELGSAEEVFVRPRHEYTRALLAAVPEADLAGRRAAAPVEAAVAAR